MNYLLQVNDTELSAFNKNWGWFLVWGLILIGLGVAAISATTLSTIISIVILGALFFASGLIIIIDAFTFWRVKMRGFWWHLIIGLLYAFAGLVLLKSPLLGSISLTLVLGICFIFAGIVRIIYANMLKLPNWGWRLFNGILTLLLGVLIVAQWPASGLYIIGLFIGIDLVFSGWAYVMTALAARERHLV